MRDNYFFKDVNLICNNRSNTKNLLNKFINLALFILLKILKLST